MGAYLSSESLPEGTVPIVDPVSCASGPSPSPSPIPAPTPATLIYLPADEAKRYQSRFEDMEAALEMAIAQRDAKDNMLDSADDAVRVLCERVAELEGENKRLEDANTNLEHSVCMVEREITEQLEAHHEEVTRLCAELQIRKDQVKLWRESIAETNGKNNAVRAFFKVDRHSTVSALADVLFAEFSGLDYDGSYKLAVKCMNFCSNRLDL